MKPIKIRVPQTILELLDVLSSMLLLAPKFLDRTGYFPYRNLSYTFQQLNLGLSFNRDSLGEQRYYQLTRMSAHIRALFEADPDDNTGDTLKGCKIIHEMEDILREVQRKA